MPVELRLSFGAPYYAGRGTPFTLDLTKLIVPPSNLPAGRSATGGQDGLSFWDARSGKFFGLWFWETEGHAVHVEDGADGGLGSRRRQVPRIIAIGYSPDGRWVAAGTAYGAVWLFDTNGAAEPRRLLPAELSQRHWYPVSRFHQMAAKCSKPASTVMRGGSRRCHRPDRAGYQGAGAQAFL